MIEIVIKILFLLLINYKIFGLWDISKIWDEESTQKIKLLSSICYLTFLIDEKMISKLTYVFPSETIYQFHNTLNFIDFLAVGNYEMYEYLKKCAIWILSFQNFYFYASGFLSFTSSSNINKKNCHIFGILNTILLDFDQQASVVGSVMKVIASSLILYNCWKKRQGAYLYLGLYDLYQICHFITFLNFVLYILGYDIRKWFLMKWILSIAAALIFVILTISVYISYFRDISYNLDAICPEFINQFYTAARDRENLNLKIIALYFNFTWNLISMVLLYNLVTFFIGQYWILKEYLFLIGSVYAGFLLNYPYSDNKYDLWEKCLNFIGVYFYLLILKYWFNNYLISIF